VFITQTYIQLSEKHHPTSKPNNTLKLHHTTTNIKHPHKSHETDSHWSAMKKHRTKHVFSKRTTPSTSRC